MTETKPMTLKELNRLVKERNYPKDSIITVMDSSDDYRTHEIYKIWVVRRKTGEFLIVLSPHKEK